MKKIVNIDKAARYIFKNGFYPSIERVKELIESKGCESICDDVKYIGFGEFEITKDNK